MKSLVECMTQWLRRNDRYEQDWEYVTGNELLPRARGSTKGITRTAKRFKMRGNVASVIWSGVLSLPAARNRKSEL